MATGVIRNFLIPAPTPAYFSMLFQHSPCKQDEEGKLEKKPEEKEDEEKEEEEEEEEEEEDEESEAQEDEEEEEEEECLEIFSNSDHYALDATKQLLRFADLISRDVQRYFGRCSGDQEACDIYSDSVSITTSGRLRYYDDLLRIARAGSPEVQESRSATHADDRGTVARGNNALGPLAELFDHRGPSQGRGQPMIKRHLPLSFWTEPIPCCPMTSFSNTPGITHTNSDAPPQDSTHMDDDTRMHYNRLTHHNTHTMDSTQPDFSDLLANWDPNPELTHTLTENTHMQH